MHADATLMSIWGGLNLIAQQHIQRTVLRPPIEESLNLQVHTSFSSGSFQKLARTSSQTHKKPPKKEEPEPQSPDEILLDDELEFSETR
jgi:hypothetical protein